VQPVIADVNGITYPVMKMDYRFKQSDANFCNDAAQGTALDETSSHEFEIGASFEDHGVVVSGSGKWNGSVHYHSERVGFCWDIDQFDAHGGRAFSFAGFSQSITPLATSSWSSVPRSYGCDGPSWLETPTPFDVEHYGASVSATDITYLQTTISGDGTVVKDIDDLGGFASATIIGGKAIFETAAEDYKATFTGSPKVTMDFEIDDAVIGAMAASFQNDPTLAGCQDFTDLCVHQLVSADSVSPGKDRCLVSEAQYWQVTTTGTYYEITVAPSASDLAIHVVPGLER
jgi:hypothetical protein